ncbi:Orotidine 5'-phosphate decarboxylase [hydrothermal vent metagenome]|uniref:Orotidine 5'-phosphate decarboxylase n=1 Tax=hydrothermal vent metagenome TaxID=652676 RepID=A0A3B0QYC3_9ZZZZ
MQAKDRIIFPLDLPTADEALRFVRLLKDHVGVFKIGLELFVAVGPAIVEAVKKEAPDAGIFLDMKFHDIPETVKRAQMAASELGVEFITVHLDGGWEMLDVAAVWAGSAKVLGVTVLTSTGAQELAAAGLRTELCEPEKLVMHRAALAKKNGLAGIVCSGLEAAKVKEEFSDELIIVTPGIRLAAGDVTGDDQKRIVTPAKAIRSGADYIVIGRPIRDAADPAEVAAGIALEIEEAKTK